MSPGEPGQRLVLLERFQQQHRTGILTLLFTDLVDSTRLKQELGDAKAVGLIQQHHARVRDWLKEFPDAQEIETAGDSFLLVFARPSAGVRFALGLHTRNRQLSTEAKVKVEDRVGIHAGEVFVHDQAGDAKLFGSQMDLCGRVVSLAQGGQVLLTRFVFDNARAVLKGEDLAGVGPLSWVSHGTYLLKGIEEAVEVCEVGEMGQSPLAAPKTTEKAQRQVRADEEPVLGWRPAVGQAVPGIEWVLEEKLGEGGFGEVWVAQHPKLKERRVFKFCFRADRVRALKRELTLFRLLKENVGQHPNIVQLYEVYLEQPPFYLEEEFVEGKDLKTWCEAQGGIEKVPLEVRLEIVAQAAEALQAAHDAGIIHRDVKPGNILVRDQRSAISDLLPESGARTVLVKLADFGIGRVVSEEYLTGVTRGGFTQTMLSTGSSGTGTQLYMAPELLAGNPASTRSDLYSLGVVLYQVLAGDFRRPVTGDWAEEFNDGLLRDDLQRCIAGKSEQRLAGARQLAERLRALPRRRAELALRQRALRRRRLARAAAVCLLLTVLVTVGSVLWLRQTHVQWAKSQAVPEMERLIEEGRQTSDFSKWRDALRLGQEASPYAAKDARFQKALDACSRVCSISSDPPGASVRLKPYDDQDADWISLGATPLQRVRLAYGFFVVKFEKAGYDAVEAVCGTFHETNMWRRLDPLGTIPPHMVRVPGREVEGLGHVPGGFIDKYEVSNRRFKEFVESGGYQNPRYWKETFIREGKTLTWQEAMFLLRDSTGRPGPSTWASGDYLPGRADYPVSGVSWFEAAAYAEFAGKSLPTKDHWAGAAALDTAEYRYDGFPTMITRFSNFHGDGPAPVGSYKGMNAFGAMDMAGNVREWCWNASSGGRFIRGGAWDDASYMYGNESQQSPWDRSDRNGFRCVVYLEQDKIPRVFFEAQGLESPRDFGKELPVPDAVFEIYKAKFQYDPNELKAVLEERDERANDWIREKVTFDAAYDNERVIVHLYLPRGRRKPYQSVVYFPGSNAVWNKSSSVGWDMEYLLDFFLKSGRAVVCPVYRGTHERAGDMTIEKHWPEAEFRHAYTEFLAKWVKDFRRSVDYLETRSDFDRDRIAFFGFSWGGILGTIIPAVEPRVRANILLLGGLVDNFALPEAQGINYISRIRVPTLMLNGRYDLGFPLETAVRPCFNLLGTSEKDKKLVVYDTDHYVAKRDLSKEALEWLDKYFGPAK